MAKFEDDENENEDKDDLSDLDFNELEDFDELDEDLFNDLDEDDEEEEKTDTFLEEEETKPSTTFDEEIQAPEDNQEKTEEVVEPTQGLVPPDQIPVSLIVELGCIQMTMDKLMQIEPGNLLDITVQPENGVDLTINGRLVAKGELIRIGENLGVRILEIG